MRDLDERIRAELSAHFDAHRPLDSDAFSEALAKRRRKRTTAKLVTASGVALLILLASIAGFSLDFGGQRSHPEPADRGPQSEVIPIPGKLGGLAAPPGSNETWVLNQRGQIGRLEGNETRFAEASLPPRRGREQFFLPGPNSTLWLAHGYRLFRLDDSGRPTGSTRFANQTKQFDIGAGYGWRHTGGAELTRIDLETFATQELPVVEDEDDIGSRGSDDLAAGLGAAWVADGTTGEVVRIDAETLDVQRFHIGRPEEPAGVDRASAYVTSVAVGDDEVWACCDDKGDVVALEPESGEVKTRIDLGGGDDEPDGDVWMTPGKDQLWLTTFGLYEQRSLDVLFGVHHNTYAVQGPFPLPGAAEQVVPTEERLLGYGWRGGSVYPISYSELSSLPYPPKPEETKTVLWLILGGIIAVLVLIVFLGRDTNEEAEEI